MNTNMADQGMTERLTLICGSDVPVTCHAKAKPNQLLLNFLQQLKTVVTGDPARLRALCFSPAPYGSDARIESIDDHPFADHTLPGPAIPIPRSADFLGMHVSQVEADVHIPLPDANRTFQMRQSIRSMQRSGSPLMLIAIHPGVIGYHVRREGIKRRLRGRAIPLVAVHWSQYHQFSEQCTTEVVDAFVKKYRPTLHDFFMHDGSFQRMFPALKNQPQVCASIENIFTHASQVLAHWYIIPSRRTSSVTWGRFWLWMASSLSSYAHHRLQGSLSAAQTLQELLRLIDSILGVPLPELLKRPSETHKLARDATADSIGQLVRRYHQWFYSECDRVINLEGANGRSDLQAIGVAAKSIVDFDLHGNFQEQLTSLYRLIVRDSALQIVPKRKRLSDFKWGQPVSGYDSAAAHLAISDIHLGDGSGTERARATSALSKSCQSLGVRSMEIVGDLIQRDVPTDQVEKHRNSFLRSLNHVTGTVARDNPQIYLSVKRGDQGVHSSKQQAEILRELHSCALKIGGVISFENVELGVPESPFGNAMDVYIERGNHDEGENLEEVVPGSIVSRSMIRHDRQVGVVFCHGNIWNLPEVSQAFLRARSLEQLESSLTETSLKSSLETAQVIYSLTSALWRATAKRLDVRSIWKKDLQPALSRLVQWHRERDKSEDSITSEFSQFVHGVISPVDNALVAAQCGSLTQSFGEFCWAVCDGHSHRPSIEFMECPHPVTGQSSGVLLINCGKFHGKNMTAAFMRFPEALLAEWDDRDQCYYVLHHYRLSDEQIALVLDANVNRVVESAVCKDRPIELDENARIMLEICTEGSGHAERQRALLPLYQQHGYVQIAASGARTLSWADEHWPGHHIGYDPTGRVRYASTLWSYMQTRGAVKQNAKQLISRLNEFTHLITDFAPNLPSALYWARKLGARDLPPLFHISHHAALHSQFHDTPRPMEVDRLTFWATQRYLDYLSGDYNLGFHFERYHPEIYTPPLLADVLQAAPSFDSNLILVYLSGAPQYIATQCAAIDSHREHEWHIYSSQVTKTECTSWPNIWLFPLDNSYRAKLINSRAAIIASGFMGPAELLHLGKPFVAVPTPGHGEQAFNAAALKEISDVTIVQGIDDRHSQSVIRRVLGDAKSLTKPLVRFGRMGQVGPYKDIRLEVVDRIFERSSVKPTQFAREFSLAGSVASFGSINSDRF